MASIDKIRSAAETISGKILRTPMIYSPTISRMFGAEIYLKLENLQKTGSFKVRGAMNKVFSNLAKIGPGGVVAASAGNHAQGVALAAKHAGIPATIVMPEWASISKQEATSSYGGQVIISGQGISESLAKAEELAADGRTLIHPFDDTDVIHGQGTIALELFEDMEDIDMILVPIGGGGLVSGIGLAAKSIRPQVKIVGVQTANCPSAYEAIRKGKIREVKAEPSIADGISVKRTGRITLKFLKKYVDEVVLAEEGDIARAILMLLERKKILAEGAGAISLAALLNGSVAVPENGKVVLLISGGNVDSPLLDRIISQGLVKSGRIMRLWIRMDDTPGSLSKLLALIAQQRANILNVTHERNAKDMPIYATRVDLEMETRNPEHIDKIAAELKKAGYYFELK
ncbi:MAG: threonine ammonia-lyase [Proteobacteria bacterium]|nr:threonine ammonia-lyase [Pseudomonadota bacterium]